MYGCIGVIMASSDVAKELDGIITPAITPFLKSGIDYEAVSKLNKFLGKNGIKAVFPAGSTGCFSFMDIAEHKETIKIFSESLAKNVKLVPGVGRNSVTETLEVLREAERYDAYAMVVVTPYYIKLDDESLFRYFDKIAHSTESRIILYNIPQFTGERISVDVAKRLARKHKNIIGIKDSSGNFRSFASYMSELPENFLVFQGQDDLLLPSLMLGAAGGVCGTTNFSDLAVKVYKAYKGGKHDFAKELQEKLTKLMHITNTVQFPEGYHYLFYRNVIGKEATNAIEPITEIEKKDRMTLYRLSKELMK
jgi:2-dehydro-3-deoxy-D-gluconate aldolase